MPREDLIHVAVRRALQKQGWRIVSEHLYLEEGGYYVYIDLAVEPGSLLAAQGAVPAVVEVKSFHGPSFMNSFQEALGQYLVYADKLEALGDPRPLYLAIPDDVHAVQFAQPSIQRLLQRYGMHLLVIDIVKEEIVTWIS